MKAGELPAEVQSMGAAVQAALVALADLRADGACALHIGEYGMAIALLTVVRVAAIGYPLAARALLADLRRDAEERGREASAVVATVEARARGERPS